MKALKIYRYTTCSQIPNMTEVLWFYFSTAEWFLYSLQWDLSFWNCQLIMSYDYVLILSHTKFFQSPIWSQQCTHCYSTWVYPLAAKHLFTEFPNIIDFSRERGLYMCPNMNKVILVVPLSTLRARQGNADELFLKVELFPSS